MHLCIYEDHAYSQFYPLTLTRPVHQLRAGIEPQHKRICRWFDHATASLVCREDIAPLLSEQIDDTPVNIIKKPADGDMLFINGRLSDPGDLAEQLGQAQLSTKFESGSGTAGFVLKQASLPQIPAVAMPSDFTALIARLQENEELATRPVTARLYNYIWDVMGDIESAIENDFAHLSAGWSRQTRSLVPEGDHLIEPERIQLEDGVVIQPGAVIDASGGPVLIGANTTVDAQAAIYGPCYVGPNCKVVAGKLSGSSIGHTCRVGGEVEESIFHAYVNKYHAGFVGHSYVGAWVNFGAMTTNSDLKNNYSTIRCTLDGKSIDTGSIKVGSFIGDHTKFGIGTLLNTGINIGVSCNLFGGTLIADKEVPSFSWGATGAYQGYDFDKAIETARRSAERRDHRLSDREVALLQRIHDKQLRPVGMIAV